MFSVFGSKPLPKLYYTKTSCGAASFIAAHTAKVNLPTEQVDLPTHKTTSGADFYQINPKGNVPTLAFEDGIILNEGSAVLQWIADQAPNTVAPANGTIERSLVQNALNYIASEIHTSVGAFFNPAMGPELKEYAQKRLATKLQYLENTFIGNKSFVVGSSFTIADSYLFVVLSWAPYLNLDYSPYPKVQAYIQHIGDLPNVKAAQARMAENPTHVLN